MNASTDVLRTLNRLSDADRDWIINRLPTQAKTRLLEISRPEDPRVVPSQTATASAVPDAHLALWQADPAALASLLQNEPVWLTVALLQSNDWPWRDALVMALPPGMRAEVERGGHPAFTIHLTDTLIGILARRLEVSAREPSTSKFEALVRRLATARSRKRWSIHL